MNKRIKEYIAVSIIVFIIAYQGFSIACSNSATPTTKTIILRPGESYCDKRLQVYFIYSGKIGNTIILSEIEAGPYILHGIHLYTQIGQTINIGPLTLTIIKATNQVAAIKIKAYPPQPGTPEKTVVAIFAVWFWTIIYFIICDIKNEEDPFCIRTRLE
ncbi:MAG: hypothetical protein ACTSQ8_23515 [Candidatus Helarchaeota archaeon]